MKVHKYSQTLAVFTLILGVSVGGVLLVAEGIGWIRAFAPLLVVFFIGATVYFHPNRLLNTAGVVVAFVGASLGWELALWVVDVIENAPSQT